MLEPIRHTIQLNPAWRENSMREPIRHTIQYRLRLVKAAPLRPLVAVVGLWQNFSHEILECAIAEVEICGMMVKDFRISL